MPPKSGSHPIEEDGGLESAKNGLSASTGPAQQEPKRTHLDDKPALIDLTANSADSKGVSYLPVEAVKLMHYFFTSGIANEQAYDAVLAALQAQLKKPQDERFDAGELFSMAGIMDYHMISSHNDLLKFIPLKTAQIEAIDLSLISEFETAGISLETMVNRSFFPLYKDKEEKAIYVLDGDPVKNTYLIEDSSKALGMNSKIKTQLAPFPNFKEIRAFYREVLERSKSESDGQQLRKVIQDRYKKPLTEPTKILVDENASAASRLFAHLFFEAVERGASDIHIEPINYKSRENRKDMLRIRNRLDGCLSITNEFPIGIAKSLISRIMILTKTMDIANMLIPQDGSFHYTHTEAVSDDAEVMKRYSRFKDREFDCRVSVVPLKGGNQHKATIRILEPKKALISIPELGVSEENLERIYSLVNQENAGVIYLNGPTGSGKTTTLYAILQEMNKPEVNITTIEDPIEYELPGVNQMQINKKQGVTWASALRSILRQDPDIILVGETRDKETAEIAFESGNTGHLVFSTVHAMDSGAVIRRLISNLGVHPIDVASVLRGVISQRLVRKPCQSCLEPYIPAASKPGEGESPEKKFYDYIMHDNPTIAGQLKIGKGCGECIGGYHGRSAVMEVMIVDDAIRELIIKNSSAQRYTEAAMQKREFSRPMTSLMQDAIVKIVKMETTIPEVIRVMGTNYLR